ncbi:MAG: tRNA (adenosine(37)-N6)-threonylcarbamoyltransferase complex ATPase subunit type 1 TsaE [Sulfurovum sp.]|nr:tRNA (adenosine(37)-N6)-threonylcarbamoyltransferase complex ATPase subunit type 1 TsaE [Sulfurovum sp.]
MPKEIIASLHEIDQITSYLSKTLPSDAIIFLHGDLASGKTTLTQAIAKERGVESEVTSPTFSLQQCYTNNLYHYDLYRLSHEAFMQMGLFEEFEKTGWHIVEWGSDALKSFLEGVGYNVHIVEIVPHKEKRIYRISS